MCEDGTHGRGEAWCGKEPWCCYLFHNWWSAVEICDTQEYFLILFLQVLLLSMEGVSSFQCCCVFTLFFKLKNLERLYKGAAKLFTKTVGISSWEYLENLWGLICLGGPASYRKIVFSVSWLGLSSVYFGGNFRWVYSWGFLARQRFWLFFFYRCAFQYAVLICGSVYISPAQYST